MKNLTELNEWQTLLHHQSEIANHPMRDWFLQDKQRFSRFSLSCCDILLDYSRNRINDKTLLLLCDLAKRMNLAEKIEALFSGHAINGTEKRPALHTALRDPEHTAIFVNHKNVAEEIQQSQKKLADFVNCIHSKTWKGITGKPISHVVNIGIGGSYIGPMMCTDALKQFAITSLQFHFIASIDKDHLDDILQKIDPETTLFIISSKSFSTLETLTNAESVSTWMKSQFGEDVIKHHFIAVTAAKDRALAFGIPEENIFPLWGFVGGRYSVWSAIGLPLMLMIGNEQFAQFLQGAYGMDQHFRQADFAQNMPVLLALLGIWYMNFFGTTAHAIIPYAHRLRYLIPYLQQADMESNGKSVNVVGHHINYTTSPVLFGEEGVIGQHAYHQLLHQGQHLIPVDFILVGKTEQKNTTHAHHDILMASALSQAQALMHGKTYEEAQQELLAHHSTEHADELAHHQIIPGNKPSNILFLKRLTPKQLGALLALYEHKIFVQGVIWDINSFDQWGVELGKQLLLPILQQIQDKHESENNSSTLFDLIRHFRGL
jgi:glucose-6-phosphate isomerase